MKKIVLCALFFSSLTILSPEPLLAKSVHKYNEQGIKYMETAEYFEAVSAFEEAYKLSAHNNTIKKNLTAAYFSLANNYAEKQDWEEAIKYAQKAYNLDNTNKDLAKNIAVLYNNYAYVLKQKDLTDSAYKKLCKALEYDKQSWVIYLSLGALMYEQGRINAARKYWAKAVEINPGLTNIKQQLARLEKESTVEDKFHKKYYGKFEVKYEGYEKDDLAWKVLDILNEAHYKLGYDFQYYPNNKITIIIYTKEQFQDITQRPEWIRGMFDGIIRVTAADIEGAKGELKNTLYHEYTHALLYHKTRNNIPKWLNEGLAQYKEPRKDFFRPGELKILKKHIADDSLIMVDKLDQAFLDQQDKDLLMLAYLESKLLIKYLDERHGFYQIRYILDKLSKGDDIDTALKETIYDDTKRLEQEWRNWLKRKYM